MSEHPLSPSPSPAAPRSEREERIAAAKKSLSESNYIATSEVRWLLSEVERLQTRLDAIREGNVWESAMGFVAANDARFFRTWDEAIDVYCGSRSVLPEGAP